MGRELAGAARAVTFAVPPLTFNLRDSLTYTGISHKLFAQLERNGTIASRPYGKNGERVYLREQLDVVTTKLFGAGATDIDDEFEDIGG